MSMIGKLTDRYPKLPRLFANTMASKVIQLIKDRALDPVFSHPSVAGRMQDLPPSFQKGVEWVFHFLSGAIRTLPDRNTIIGIAAQEALAESLTQTSIKIHELSVRERFEIIDASLPMIRGELTSAVRKDSLFRGSLLAFFGTAQQWNDVIADARDTFSQVDEEIRNRRAARKARGWRRFFWRSR